MLPIAIVVITAALPGLRWHSLLLNYRAAQQRTIWKSNNGSANIPWAGQEDEMTQGLMQKPTEESRWKRDHPAHGSR